MKIRRRAHPIDPRRSLPNTNKGACRCNRHGTPLYNHGGANITDLGYETRLPFPPMGTPQAA